jgi:Skp family chaperone for outer membrane proteins
MMMKVRALLAIAAVIPGMFLVQTSGGTTVAVVDFRRAVEETPDGKSAITKLTTFGTEQEVAIKQKVKEADDLESQIRAQNGVRSDAARAQMQRDLDAARAKIQSMGEDAQNKFDQMQEQLLRPVQLRTATAVRGYAAEHGLKIVLDASVLQDGLFYVHDTADITSEIIRRIASDLNRPGAQHASLIENTDTPQQRLLHRTWNGVNFAQQLPPQVPMFPILTPVKLARN